MMCECVKVVFTFLDKMTMRQIKFIQRILKLQNLRQNDIVSEIEKLANETEKTSEKDPHIYSHWICQIIPVVQ